MPSIIKKIRRPGFSEYLYTNVGTKMIDFALGNKSTVFFTSLGWMGIRWADNRVIRLTFGQASEQDVARTLGAVKLAGHLTPVQESLVKRLKAFAQGNQIEFDDVSIDLANVSEFQQRVLRRCRRIKWGETASYGQLAQAVGSPAAARAVGTAMAKNPVPIVVPCHRVVRSGGKQPGGFSAPGGISLKLKMLNLENAESLAAV